MEAMEPMPAEGGAQWTSLVGFSAWSLDPGVVNSHCPSTIHREGDTEAGSDPKRKERKLAR